MTTVQNKLHWLAKIIITRKSTVVDPQGNTVLDALRHLHFESADHVRIGKYIEVSVHAADEASARIEIVNMCETLLVNPVIEQFSFDLQQID